MVREGAQAWILEDALRRKEVKTEAFARWIEEEKQANDSVYTFPRLEEEDRMVAAELAMDALPEEADVVIPGQSGDPLVIAQALLRNAEMVGTDNMGLVDRDSVDGWIAGKNRDGRFLHAARPFIRSADALVESRVAATSIGKGSPPRPGSPMEPAGRTTSGDTQGESWRRSSWRLPGIWRMRGCPEPRDWSGRPVRIGQGRKAS